VVAAPNSRADVAQRAPLAWATPQATVGYGHAKRLRQEAALAILALHYVWRFNARMPDTGIDFSAPATLRKWPSLNKQRVIPNLSNCDSLTIPKSVLL
jgi:hypothetical protein